MPDGHREARPGDKLIYVLAQRAPSRAATLAYRETLTRLWILDQVAGWRPIRNPVTRLASAPKHHLADAARLLGLGAGALIDGADPTPAIPRAGALLGALFESLVTLDVRTYAQAAGGRPRVGHISGPATAIGRWT